MTPYWLILAAILHPKGTFGKNDKGVVHWEWSKNLFNNNFCSSERAGYARDAPTRITKAPNDKY